ncbi:Subtilase family protein, putative isoform 1 [Theobroma cacao]|uniref:Subtilase family protein, putative isoform 1 n=1 Tax=Theobroma cacao TaxID=3641 RepID=A0A061GWL7_THECC|nr:Subtilase family protein, putative isoform 1 [Theobroma cacao]
MAKSVFEMFLGLSFVLMLSMSLSPGATDEDRKVYIAYLGSLPERDYSPSSHHFSMLQAVIKQSSVANYLIRSYKRSFNGFAAKLTNEEANKLASMKEVVSIFPNKVYHLQTTRSWDFLGLKDSVKRNPTVESDVIIGVIDSGIWPESESFSDKGFGPAPKKWKGSCSGGKNFTCNNKLIGARFYNSEEPREESARDGDGHGTHTASTAAGNNVEDASFFGLAQGTARGGVPSARIAAYKVCKQNGCASADILAAFDDAIADGVDLITISVGSTTRSDFYQDSIAIGAFHAAEKGILTVQSAGNEGRLGKQGVTSVVPWILTVAASSIDRRFFSKVVLGNGKTLNGLSINSFDLKKTKFPLVYGKEIANLGCNEEITARVCETGCLNSTLVKEKIVLCDQFRGNNEARDAGAAGSILKTEIDDVSFVLPLAASALSTDNYESVKSYLNSTKRPVAEILRSETIEDSAAPVVAPFSSRGPNFMEPDIMKPDLSAPGVDILAAFSPIGSPSGNPADKRQVKYSILSGTSMSCPHAAAVAAYVKTFHPEWSPSAIQSALMTTAFPMDQSTNPDGELAYGSGHVNPVKATDPGLVYEVVKGDYIKFLCSIGYDSEKLRRISGDNSTCSKTSENILPRDLNYPSLTAQILPDKSFTVGFHRTVTNVGIASSTYKAKVSSNSKLEVKVDPEVLSFKALKEKKSFNVTVTGDALSLFSMVSASLEWSDGTHSVKSPIVIHSYKSFRLEGSTL